MSAQKDPNWPALEEERTKEIYLVTRLYSEALNTMVILRKSGPRTKPKFASGVSALGRGKPFPGFSPAQDD